MKRYSVATSCMIESPRNSILWLWPLDEREEEKRECINSSRAGENCSQRCNFYSFLLDHKCHFSL